MFIRPHIAKNFVFKNITLHICLNYSNKVSKSISFFGINELTVAALNSLNTPKKIEKLVLFSCGGLVIS